MKSETIYTTLSRALGSQLAVGLLASLCLTTSSLAKKGGGKPGGGESQVPPVVAAPVSYASTQLQWGGAEADYYVFLNCINSKGLAVGYVSVGNGSQDPVEWMWQGAVNLGYDEQSGEMVATDAMVDLNILFKKSLARFNAGRSDGLWRIDQAHGINAVGQIGCRLIPAGEPRWRGSAAAAAAGVAPVPCLLAVADLRHLPEPESEDIQPALDALLIMDPNDTSSDKYLEQVTENGDVFAYVGTVGASNPRTLVDFRLYLDQGNSYAEIPLPDDVASWPANVNAALDVVCQTVSGSTFQMFKYSLDPASQLPGTPIWNRETLWESNDRELHAEAVAEDGSVYAEEHYTATKGRNKGLTLVTPYHITEAGRTPLVDAGSEGSAEFGFRYLSRAVTAGEEELILWFSNTGELQIYKSNFGARFPLPIAPFSVTYIGVSPPALFSGSYLSGYVAYSSKSHLEPDGLPKSYILTPMPLTP